LWRDDWEELARDLFTYKYMAELTLLGVTADQNMDDDTFIAAVVRAKAEEAVPTDDD